MKTYTDQSGSSRITDPEILMNSMGWKDLKSSWRMWTLGLAWLPGTLGKVLETLVITAQGWGCYWHLGVEARDAAQHHAGHRMALTVQD